MSYPAAPFIILHTVPAAWTKETSHAIFQKAAKTDRFFLLSSLCHYPQKSVQQKAHHFHDDTRSYCPIICE